MSIYITFSWVCELSDGRCQWLLLCARVLDWNHFQIIYTIDFRRRRFHVARNCCFVATDLLGWLMLFVWLTSATVYRRNISVRRRSVAIYRVFVACKSYTADLIGPTMVNCWLFSLEMISRSKTLKIIHKMPNLVRMTANFYGSRTESRLDTGASCCHVTSSWLNLEMGMWLREWTIHWVWSTFDTFAGLSRIKSPFDVLRWAKANHQKKSHPFLLLHLLRLFFRFSSTKQKIWAFGNKLERINICQLAHISGKWNLMKTISQSNMSHTNNSALIDISFGPINLFLSLNTFRIDKDSGRELFLYL